MKSHFFKVKGMHCASCASVITKKISALPNITSVTVNYGSEKAKIEYDPDLVPLETINAEISKLGYSLIPEDQEVKKPMTEHHTARTADPELETLRNKTYFMLPLTLGVFALMLWDILAQTTTWMPKLALSMEIFNTVSLLLATVALFWVGKPYLQGVGRFLRFRVANMDTLVGLGTLTAYLYSMAITLVPQFRTFLRLPEYTYFDVTIVVIGFITLGKYLEARSKKKTGEALEKLIGLQAKTALVIRDGKEVEIPAAEVKHGDHIIIKPGGKIPVDGIVLEGTSFVDESMVSGEPMPVEKTEGHTVIAGTINSTGSFTFRATKVGSETLLAHIIKMVEEAQGSKAPIEALADKISAVFVPIVLGIAAITLLLWITVGPQFLGFSQSLSFGILSFVSILVIACPCALGLATPTAVMVGVGKGALNGILIKDAAALELLQKVDTVIVDKTGTITIGKPTLVELRNQSALSDEAFLSILASLENKSEHPIAHAIVTRAREKNLSLKPVREFKTTQGKGVQGEIEGKEYRAGNVAFLTEAGCAVDASILESSTAQGKTPVLLAEGQKILGFVMVADEVKKESKRAIEKLHKLGIRVLMLTGDDEKAAKHIASLVGIDEVIAHVLPQGKLEKIKALQKEGRVVAMAGDGVNDSPALAQADVGIAMGTGTDIAIESASITLLRGDISKLAKAIRLSKMTMRGIKQNLFWAFLYNIAGIPLAAGVLYPFFGWLLSPIFAGMAMAFSSVSVVANSLRLKMKKL